MPRALLQRLRSNRGFSLIELLVTILILGLLAAIAIPAYLGHQKKGKDSDAQSNARNLAAHVELCFATQEDFTQCDTEAELVEPGQQGGMGVAWGSGKGRVELSSTAVDAFEIVAHSHAGNVFKVSRGATGILVRTCTQPGRAGCPKSGTW